MSKDLTVSPRGIRRELLRYLTVGAVNTLIGLAAIYLAIVLFRANDAVANLAGYSLGLACSYVLNRRWTFASDGAVAPQLVKFVLVMLVAYLANLGTVLGLTRYFAENRYLAQAIGALPYTIIGYLGSRLLAFPQRVME